MQKSQVRSWLGSVAVGLGVIMVSNAAQAAGDYPNKPVTIVVGYGAGGGADTIARLYAEKLQGALKQSFVVENKPGAGATLGAAAVARSPNDGYTLMVAPTAVFTVTPIVRKTPYDPIADFTPIGNLATGLDVIIKSKAVPAQTLEEFIVLAKKNPGVYSFASSGLATSTHLMGEFFQEAAGIKLLHVPYKSSNDYLPDLIQGRVSLAFDPVLLNQVSGGKLDFLAIAGDARLPGYPKVGTTKEARIDMSLAYDRLWYGLFGPKDLPPEVLQRLSDAIKKISSDPEVAAKLAATGMAPKFISPSEFKSKIGDDARYFGDLIKKLDLKLEQ